jgi:AAT family amino acid transporter
MNNNNVTENWIATRELVPKWSVGISGLVNLIVLIIATFVIWWVVFANAGPFKLYTPLLGFSLVIWTLLIMLWQIELFDFWPLKRDFLNNAHPLMKGGLLTAITIVSYVILVFGVLYLIIGRYGITYFNWPYLNKIGKLGTDILTSREITSWAMLCMSVPFFLISVWVMLGIGKDLFPELSQPKLGIANWLLIATISIPLFFIFFHPHIGSMFYPAQIYTAVPPWWKNLAHTNSAEYSLGYLFCTVVAIFYTIHLWEGRPWNLVKSQPWRCVVFVVGSLILGILLVKIELYCMDYLWDEAYIGGQNEANFGWRYSHTVTIANFLLVPAIILNFFFSQAFSKMNLILRGITKSVIALVAGLLFAMAYYAWGPALLGVCPGVSHPSENAAAFLLLIINLLIIQDNFMDGWPGYRLKR